MCQELSASVMAIQQNPRGPVLCRLRPGATFSFAGAVPGRNKHFGEEMLAGWCSVAALLEREQRACGVSRFSIKNGQTQLNPRYERSLLLRGTAKIGSWSFKTLLGYLGFANLPANSKQPLQACTPHRALPGSTALPSTPGRRQNRDSPTGGLGAGAAQAVPATGRGSQHLGGVCLLTAVHHPRDGY